MLVSQVAPEVVGARLEGQPLAGPLQAWSGGTLTLETDGKPVAIGEQELITLRSPAHVAEAPPSELVVEFVDGTRLPANNYEVVDGEAVLELDDFWTTRHQVMRVPVGLFRAV